MDAVEGGIVLWLSQVNRSLSRKIAELEATNHALDREAGTLREHIKRLQDEIAVTHKQHLSLSEEVMNAQRENTTLQRWTMILYCVCTCTVSTVPHMVKGTTTFGFVCFW